MQFGQFHTTDIQFKMVDALFQAVHTKFKAVDAQFKTQTIVIVHGKARVLRVDSATDQRHLRYDNITAEAMAIGWADEVLPTLAGVDPRCANVLSRSSRASSAAVSRSFMTCVKDHFALCRCRRLIGVRFLSNSGCRRSMM